MINGKLEDSVIRNAEGKSTSRDSPKAIQEQLDQKHDLSTQPRTHIYRHTYTLSKRDTDTVNASGEECPSNNE